MTDHYYTAHPSSESKPVETVVSYRGLNLRFKTDSGVFSRGELDPGTRILLSALPEEIKGDVLDLGCGWGAIGVCVALKNPACRLTFSDVNERALGLSRENAALHGVRAAFVSSDGFAGIAGVFDCILTNPPIRAGKQTIYKMFADSVSHLTEKGEMYLVIRKQQGAPSALAYLKTLFPEVDVVEKSGGYWVICCRKRDCNEI